MLRIIVRTENANALAHGAAEHCAISFRTFDIEWPEVEALLRKDDRSYVQAQVIGVEVLPATQAKETT